METKDHLALGYHLLRDSENSFSPMQERLFLLGNVMPDIWVFSYMNGKDFRDKDEYRLSSFYSVVISQDGSMLVAENRNEIYSNEELLELASEVNEKTGTIGTIGSLMYYKADKGGYTLITFLDNSLNQKSMSALLKYTLYGGILAIVVFFFLSVYLARMIIRPLEENHIKQKQFISDAGHELKTPISVVSANAELLEREIGENQWLSNIQYENERMGALVTQLLDLARMENVTPQMEIVDFSHLVSGETLLKNLRIVEYEEVIPSIWWREVSEDYYDVMDEDVLDELDYNEIIDGDKYLIHQIKNIQNHYIVPEL